MSAGQETQIAPHWMAAPAPSSGALRPNPQSGLQRLLPNAVQRGWPVGDEEQTGTARPEAALTQVLNRTLQQGLKVNPGNRLRQLNVTVPGGAVVRVLALRQLLSL